MRNIIYFFLFIITSLFSCSKATEYDSEWRLLTFSTQKISLKDSVDFVFIPLETQENFLIGEIIEVQFLEDRLFVLDRSNANNLYVFDKEGDFLSQVGTMGNAPGQYNRIASFDVDSDRRLIIVHDVGVNQLLHFDLDTYLFKYSKKLPIWSDVHILSEGRTALFAFNGVDDTRKQDVYLMVTDSLIEPLGYYFDAPYKSGYITSLVNKTMYSLKGQHYVYHPYAPFVYEILHDDIKPTYRLDFEGMSFPSSSFLERGMASQTNYTQELIQSNHISCYAIFECRNMICIPIHKSGQFHFAIYPNHASGGYLFTMSDWYKTMGLGDSGVYIKPQGASAEYIIGSLSMHNLFRSQIRNPELKRVVEKAQPDDNPVICLMKWKKER